VLRGEEANARGGETHDAQTYREGFGSSPGITKVAKEDGADRAGAVAEVAEEAMFGSPPFMRVEDVYEQGTGQDAVERPEEPGQGGGEEGVGCGLGGGDLFSLQEGRERGGRGWREFETRDGHREEKGKGMHAMVEEDVLACWECGWVVVWVMRGWRVGDKDDGHFDRLKDTLLVLLRRLGIGWRGACRSHAYEGEVEECLLDQHCSFFLTSPHATK
jgi:hypothetical protein